MLDKKLCREFAAPGVPISMNNGLLHAEQIEYIIQTAVKIIGHRRVLILYIYSREQAAQGNPLPLWTMFHCNRDGYVTLARQPDGSVKWRTAAFEHLGDDWRFISQCAFYSAKDRRRLTSYFHADDEAGVGPLVRAQDRMLARRLAVRQKARARKIHDRMRNLPALPRGLEAWAHRTVMPAYFFYDYQRNAKSVPGICTACGHEIALEKIRHNSKAVCPNCGRELTAKSRGRRGRLFDRDTCQVVQRIGPNEVLVRIVKVMYSYKLDTPQGYCRENARIFVRLDRDGGIQAEPYYYSYGEKDWKRGFRPVFYKYCRNYEADICAHVYCGNLPGALKGTPWQYCPVERFYVSDHERMEMVPFLKAHLEHPRLEHLIKTGFYTLANDLIYRNSAGSLELDESQNRTHRILGIAAGDVDFLRGLDVNAFTLSVFQEYARRNLKDRQELLRWQLEHGVERDISQILEHMTAHKLMRYLEGQYRFLQYRKNKYHVQRYRNMQSLVGEYRDYLDMCVKQEYDMRNSFILYPKDLQKSHDRVAHRIKLKADAQMRRDFKAVYRLVGNSLDYEYKGLKIVCPATAEDIIAEGNALHHCVGGYVDRVARQECIIVFLRHGNDESKPFYTIEIQGRQTVQVRGMGNRDPTPEVEKFVSRWERDVLRAERRAAA